MTTLTESTTYTAGIYQIETTDSVLGGAGGTANLQAQQLADRTNWLNAQITALASAVTSASGTFTTLQAGSLTLSGTSSVPTKSPGDNTTSIASTAFVTAAVASAAPAALAFNTLLSSDTAYTVAASDATGSGVIEPTASSAVVITVPANATTALPLDTPIFVKQSGTGQVSIVGASGVTINYPASASGASLSGQGSWAFLVQESTNVWSLEGDLSGSGSGSGSSSGKYSPDNIPAGIFADEEWLGNSEALSWTWGNQQSTTQEIAGDQSILTYSGSSGVSGKFIAAPTSGDMVVATKFRVFNSGGGGRQAGLMIITGGTLAAPTGVYAGYVDDAGNSQLGIGYAGPNSGYGSGGTSYDSNNYPSWMGDYPAVIRARYISSSQTLIIGWGTDGYTISDYQSWTGVAQPLFVGYYVFTGTVTAFQWFRCRQDVSATDGFKSIVGA
jgi:hypothetical protein